jgi:oligopeptide transport system substrate-binding protein
MLELTGWSSSQISVLEAVQAMWRQELGVGVSVAVRDAKVHFAALMGGDYDIGYMTAIPDVADPADLLGRFRSTAPENFPHWSDQAFDQAVFAGDFVTAESRLLEAAVAVPLYFNARHWLMSPRVRGWREDAMWTGYHSEVRLGPQNSPSPALQKAPAG